MKSKINFGMVGVVCVATILAGCVGTDSFTRTARPGETIALSAGWQQELTRSDLTVVITPASGVPFTYNPGNSQVRTIFQGYPDPVSKLVVSDRAGVEYPNAGVFNNPVGPSYGQLVRNGTAGENDWSDTIIFMNLPRTISPGPATIALRKAGVNIITPANVEILPVAAGGGNAFTMSNYSGLSGPIRSIERAPHYIVRFTGPSGVIPHSIQADFVRTLAETETGGTAWVTHPRGDIQSTMWSDTGSLIKVMVTPVKGTTTNLLTDFKFYVTGAVTSLGVNSVKAYDIAGNPLTGFNATLQFVNN